MLARRTVKKNMSESASPLDNGGVGVGNFPTPMRFGSAPPLSYLNLIGLFTVYVLYKYITQYTGVS